MSHHLTSKLRYLGSHAVAGKNEEFTATEHYRWSFEEAKKSTDFIELFLSSLLLIKPNCITNNLFQ